MKFFLLTSLVAFAVARPDIGLDLRRITSYGAPASSIGSLSGNEQVKSDIIVTPTPPPSSFEVPIFGNAQFQSNVFGGKGGFSDQLASFGGSPNIFASQGGFGLQPNFAYGGINPEISLHSGANLDSVGISNHQAEVQKHVYFYTAPEDIEVPRQRVLLPSTPPQKHYKVIFIKAPTFNLPPPVEIPAPQQNEEKTLVYVLVKKPDEAGEIRVASPPPTPPTKPEVFFIKYKTQKEAEEAISNVHNGNINPSGLNSVEGEHAFASSIAQDARSGISHEGGVVHSTTVSPIGTTFGTTLGPIGIQSSTINPFINERFGVQSSTIGPLDLPNISFNSGLGGGNFGDFGLQSSTISPLGGYSGFSGGFGLQGGSLGSLGGFSGLSSSDFGGVQSSTVSPLGGFSGLAFNGGGGFGSTVSPLGVSGLHEGSFGNGGILSSTTHNPLAVESASTIGSVSGEHVSGGANGGVSLSVSGGHSDNSINEESDGKFASGISYSGSSSTNTVVVPHKEYGTPNKK